MPGWRISTAGGETWPSFTGAGLETGLAAQTAVLAQGQLGPRGQAFRIVAPGAVQGTALEEDRGADAGPVVQRVALDVEDHAGHSGGRDHA